MYGKLGIAFGIIGEKRMRKDWKVKNRVVNRHRGRSPDHRVDTEAKGGQL